MKTCSITQCADPASSRGWCNKHYLSFRRYGDPEAARTLRKRGEGTVTRHGYKVVRDAGERKFEHVALAEKALGRPLPDGAQVHHVDEDRSNNAPGNLVLCPDQAYHTLLHVRQRAMDACGNPNYRRCWICRQYGDPAGMADNNGSLHHHECRRARDAERKAA